MDIDFSQLPEPIPADADDLQATTPMNQPIVTNQGQPFDMSLLPEPLPAEAPIGDAQRSLMVEIPAGLAHGAESAVREAAKTAGDMALHTIVPPFMRDATKTFIDSLNVPQVIDKPQTTLGLIESDLVRFGLGFLAGGTVIKGAGAVANMGKSALGTGVVADPHAERLSNFVEQYPFLSNPVTDYLSSDPTDSRAEGKFKASLEDVMTNSVAQLAFKTFKLAKGAFSGKVDDVGAASVAEDILKTGQPKAAASAMPTIDPVVKAEQAREAITPDWSPLKLSDEKAIQFKEKLDGLFKSKAIMAEPKADGSVSVAHMDSTPDVLNTVTELSKLIAPEMKVAGFTAHQSNIATKELADQLGMNTDALIGGLRAAGATADQIAPMVLAGRGMVQGLASNISKATQKALVTGEGKDAAIAEIKRFTEVLSSFKSLQTGVARGLQVFGAKVGPLNVDELTTALKGKDGDELLKVFAMAEGDPTAISKIAQAAATSGLRNGIDSHNEIWINALLSGPKTHVVNMASTTLNMLTQPLNLVVGGTIRREWADVREGAAMYGAMKRHLFDSFRLAFKAFLLDGPQLSANLTNEVRGHAISSVNYGLDAESIIGQGVDWLGKAIRLPTRFLGAEDEFYKQLAYRSKVSAQATREAFDLMQSGQLSKADLGAHIDDRVKAAFNGEGQPLNAEALAYADRATFTQDLKTATWLGNKSFGETLQTLASTHPVLRGTVLPFVRVPANLMRQVIDYTPVVGQMRKQFYADFNAGGQKRTEAIGRLSLGTTAWIGAGFLANDGLVTGAAPQDPEVRNALLATGWQPYSIKVGDTYVSYNRLDPFGSVLGLTADYIQISGHLPENKRDEIASTMTLSLVNNLSSKSYLKGLIDTLTVVGSSDPGKINRWIRQRAASYIPSAVGSVNPDREMKEVRSVLDAAMSKIPGLSSSIPAKRDMFGEKKMMPGSFPFSAINPFVTSEEKPDPVRKELARLATGDSQAQFGTPPEHIGNIDLVEFKNSAGVDAYDRYTQLIGEVTDGSGRNLHRSLQDKINSEIYRRGTDGTSWYKGGSRVDMLRSVHDHFKDRAMLKLKQEFPQMASALREDKRNRIAVKHGRELSNPAEALKSLTD